MTKYKIVEFQNEKYKQFESIEQAEDYRESLHGDDCMDNERLSRLPFLLDDSNPDNFDYWYDSIDIEYGSYLNVKDNGCCGFMDEKIFIGNQMYIIGCNFGH